MSKTNTNTITITITITISRNLFERLCEAAVQVEAQSRWMDGEYGKPFQQEYDEHLRTMNEALAIRDGAK